MGRVRPLTTVALPAAARALGIVALALAALFVLPVMSTRLDAFEGPSSEVLSSGVPDSSGPYFGGPLSYVNRFPLTEVLLSPSMESPALNDSVSAEFSYSSIYMVRQSAHWNVGLDMEMARVDLSIRKVLYGFELGLSLPVVSNVSGFMDHVVNEFHDTLGLGDYGRKNRPDNSFLYEVRHDGVLVIRGKDGRVGLGDLRITAKRSLFDGDPALSVLVSAEAPTGDSKAGLGNGSFDGGLAFLASKGLGSGLMSYASLGLVLPGDFRGYETLKTRAYLNGGAALELALSRRLSAIVQSTFMTNPLPSTGIREVDNPALTLAVGAHYAFGDSGKNRVEFSFVEDLNTSAAPDFSINVAYKMFY